MNERNIKKGRSILAIKIKGVKSEPIYGLEKIPVESLYKLALEQIGEQESYIEEMEEKIKAMEEKRKSIRKEERISLMSEINKEAVLEAKKTQHVQSLERRLSKQGETIKRLYEGRNDLLKEIAKLKETKSKEIISDGDTE